MHARVGELFHANIHFPWRDGSEGSRRALLLPPPLILRSLVVFALHGGGLVVSTLSCCDRETLLVFQDHFLHVFVVQSMLVLSVQMVPLPVRGWCRAGRRVVTLTWFGSCVPGPTEGRVCAAAATYSFGQQHSTRDGQRFAKGCQTWGGTGEHGRVTTMIV